MSDQKPAPTKEEVEKFLTERCAQALDVATSEIDVERPLVAYGLDSVSAVAITGELEDWLQIRLSPMLLYDNPTIVALSGAIADEVRVKGD